MIMGWFCRERKILKVSKIGLFCSFLISRKEDLKSDVC